jgi:hypothetical protein
MRLFLIALCLFFTKMAFASVYLYNDSPFTLRAVVIAANGVHLGEKVLKGQELHYLEDQIGMSDPVGNTGIQPFTNYSNSMTPYTVIWYCQQDDSLYGTCTVTAAGATVMASSCPGDHHCKPPKKEDGKSGDAYKKD